MEKKVPKRVCVGCREQFDKKDLVRVVRTPEGLITIDLKGKQNGRGAYLCRNRECLEKAIRNKGLERTLKVNIPEETIERLKEEL